MHTESSNETSTALVSSGAAERAESALDRAGRKIAPLWPLEHFVAVNPFLGVTAQSFEEAARTMARAAGARMTPPRSFFARAIDSGRITDADLEKALAEAAAGGPDSVERLKAAARTPEPRLDRPETPTVADVARKVTGTDWAAFATHHISNWAASHFDRGQAFWTSPWSSLSPFVAWRREAEIDKTPEVAGLAGFRDRVADLPESVPEAAAFILDRLGVPEAGVDAYLHRCATSIGGWAAYARYRVWDAELYGKTDGSLNELLTVRLAWDWAIHQALSQTDLPQAWSEAARTLDEPALDAELETALRTNLILQDAFEKSLQRELVSKFAKPRPAPEDGASRKKVQAAFCIDVRSEVFRRALETVDSEVETIGFAGFFGFPIEFVPLGEERGGAQCPVLLTPQVVVEETVRGGSVDEAEGARTRRERVLKASKAWRSFKFAAVSCFGFVGPVGLAYAKKLFTDSLGWTRPVETRRQLGFEEGVRERLGPRLEPGEVAGRATGMTVEQRIAVAQGVLQAMSLTENFARLVMLTGHGSTTVNNPHATGLDCGACGGHTGEANARFAAAVLNDPAVREGLKAKGLEVPDDTIFLGCQHDTCTDEIEIFDLDQIPASHAEDLAQLQQRLAAAGQIARSERARLLQLDPGLSLDAAVVARSKDWSQVRPEWGLAGCSAFVAAPRHRTKDLDLSGRSFLHSYEWEQDRDYGVLELIMTAPMVVASWISLQYYGSTVDNRVFGCGNKTLHNVAGTLGVLEGNGGDLRVGLPWQSVHDGENYVHEPTRLNVMIEAPIEAMNGIIEKHAAVRELLDHGWLHLFAIDESGQVAHRYDRDLQWKPVEATPDSLAA
jgi:uncharacterized protein